MSGSLVCCRASLYLKKRLTPISKHSHILIIIHHIIHVDLPVVIHQQQLAVAQQRSIHHQRDYFILNPSQTLALSPESAHIHNRLKAINFSRLFPQSSNHSISPPTLSRWPPTELPLPMSTLPSLAWESRMVCFRPLKRFGDQPLTCTPSKNHQGRLGMALPALHALQRAAPRLRHEPSSHDQGETPVPSPSGLHRRSRRQPARR